MSWTQTDLDALNKAISSGARRVSYRDKTVEYRDLREMMELRAQMEKQISPSSRVTRVYATTSTGL